MITIRQVLRNILTRDEVRSIIFFEVIAGIIFSYASLILFQFITSDVLQSETIFIDSSIANFIISYRQAWLTNVMLILSLLGNEFIIFGSFIMIIFLTLKKHHRETFIFSVLLIMGTTLTSLLKLLYKIPRPFFLALVKENSYSYPSGHALNSILFYGAISYFIYHFTKNKTISALIFTISVFLIISIGISRIYLGVHHPSDVAAGFVVGFWLLVTTILIDKTIIFFRLIRESPRG
jgi:undecaprenyl-diphosphatase